MNIFWADEIAGNTGRLLGQEARHCIQVLRHKPGDTIHIIDGRGHHWQALISAASKDWVELNLEAPDTSWGEPARETGLIFAPLRDRDRTEWLLEKAVELGATHLYPVLVQHSVARAFNHERAERILIAGLKQCKRSRLPQLAPMQPLDKLLPALPVSWTLRLAGWCPATQPYMPLVTAAAGHVLLATGPEGDFGDGEAALLAQYGFVHVSLGQTRMRAETAAVAMLAARNLSLSCRHDGFI